MSRTIDELADRLDRLERDLREVSVAVSRSHPKQPDRNARSREQILDRVSFVAWLELTGPTFATLVLGFALVWNSLQATNAQMLEITRAVGRLEGSISALDGSISELRGSVQALSERVAQLER